MYASCLCGTGHSFDVKLSNFDGIYFSHVRWASSKMVHVGPIESSFCGTVTFSYFCTWARPSITTVWNWEHLRQCLKRPEFNIVSNETVTFFITYSRNKQFFKKRKKN